MRVLLAFCVLCSSVFADNLTLLTTDEQREVDERIERFYENFQPEVMQAPIQAWDMNRGTWAIERRRQEPRDLCATLKNTFPRLYRHHCAWEVMGEKDRIETLTQGLEEPEKLVYSLSRIPIRGQVKNPMWSDDYWRTMWGGVAYRYADAISYPTYEAALAAYSQPESWLALGEYGAIDRWSPAEKYDITVGDDSFALTQQQRNEGKWFVEQGEPIPAWVGICDGWSAAALTLPAPQKSITVVGLNNTPVTFYPADIRALASLSWARGNFKTNFIGGKCTAANPETHANGRIKDPTCFDNNPATFHLALGNVMGRHSRSFVLDRVFSHEVWNQPLYSYEMTFFDPLNPKRRSKDWRKVAAEYNDEFRSRDRFQNPLTRAEGVTKVVGVITTVVYLEEYFPPAHGPEVEEPSMTRKTFTYDLELFEDGGDAIALGGEWHENKHPDFLWMPKPGSFAKVKEDKEPIDYDGEEPVDSSVTELARKASRRGAPLCQVLKFLFEKSADQPTYACTNLN